MYHPFVPVDEPTSACASGLQQPSKNICQNCTSFHDNAICSVDTKGVKMYIYTRCANLEQATVGNWYGQGTTINKRNRSSYLEPRSEVWRLSSLKQIKF